MVYGLIIPPGIPVAVAEALEGDHHNPAIDEMQTRMSIWEYVNGPEFTLPQKMRGNYVKNGTRKTKWFALGERYGRQ